MIGYEQVRVDIVFNNVYKDTLISTENIKIHISYIA